MSDVGADYQPGQAEIDRAIAPGLGRPRTCATCDYYEPSNDTSGECRIGPPTAHVVMVPAPDDGASEAARQLLGGRGAMGPMPMVMGAFPATQPQFWCGAHSDGD